LEVVTVAVDGTVQLRFKSDIGRKHRVDVSFDLVEWHSATGEFKAEDGGWVRWIESDLTVPPAGRRQSFYRVAVE
jgi:hypothetical protein